MELQKQFRHIVIKAAKQVDNAKHKVESESL